MVIGYARVSTTNQNLAGQIAELKKHGAEQIFSDKKSGKNIDRPELGKALSYIRPGDTLLITDLTRLGRSLKDLISIVEQLKDKGIYFKTISHPIDTSTPAGELTFTIFAALAEYERNIIKERTHKGLEAARARGRTGGRPPLNQAKVNAIKEMYISKKYTVNHILKAHDISRTTLYNYREKNWQVA